MPKVYAIDGITPVIDVTAFVHPSAVLIGDVIIGAGAYVGPCACLRGDFGRIVVEAGADAVVAAMAFVKAEAKIPPRSLAAGIPARVLRMLTEEEILWKHGNAEIYRKLANRSAHTMQLVEPLTAVEPGRKRIDIPDSIPLSELKARKA